jgi:L-lactate dehydrogenase complex protein LldF
MTAHITSPQFKDNAHRAMGNAQLQKALGNVRHTVIARRAAAAAALPEFEALRDQARDIRNHVLEHLDLYLEEYERKVTAAGGHVHFARDSQEACRIITGIARARGAKTVTKGKSMVSEEIGLNAALESAGIAAIETDLGEYIIQLRGETPSHIIMPAVHLNQEDVEQEFRKQHTHLDPARNLDDAETLLAEARGILRDTFLKADIGVTGANFLIAETGTSIIVTNEGNGDLTQTLPKVHVVVASIEKVTPTLDDAAAIIRVLARSATGQDMSVYTTLSTGPRRADDVDGPEEYHVVLVDNGRSAMPGTEFQDMLRCIRCGACMNHCPVYHAVGGHAYGWVYPGPMGAVLTPSLIGVDKGGHLPNASTFCGRCESACPVHIPLPKLMRHWREREFERHLTPARFRLGLALWSYGARRPALYRLVTSIAMRLMHWAGGKRGRFAKLPMASGWTDYRDFPAPQGSTFQAQWKRREGKST